MRTTQYKRRIFLHERRDTNNEIRTTRYASRFTLHASRNSGGFTLLALVGILAIMTIAAAAIGPNLITLSKQTAQDTESQHLEEIHKGLNTYLRKNLAWPGTFSSLSPDYSSVSGTQLTQNDRGFPRYYAVHPTMNGFSNAAGIASAEVEDARVLVISDTSVDAAPTITNGAQFQNWWETAETADLHVQKDHVGSLFHQVTLSATGAGGSYQIDGVATSSGGGTMAGHTRHHFKGTVIGLDEANTYGTPELQFALTENVTYTFVPCLPAGSRWTIPPVDSCTALWISTSASAGGTPGLSSWRDAHLVKFDDPNLTFDAGLAGVTSGTFVSTTLDLEDFTSSTDIDAAHYVSKALTIRGFAFEVGDVLLSVDATETLTSANKLTVDDEDVFVFRPTTVRDYSAGQFFMLIDGSDIGFGEIEAITMVEVSTSVAGVALDVGDFLYSDHGDTDVHRFQPTSLGSTTSGTLSLFLDGSDIGVDVEWEGIELVERQITVGDVTLQPGQILASLTSDDASVGQVNPISVSANDIFVLTPYSVGGTTSSEVAILFDGSDVGLSGSNEVVDAVTLTGNGEGPPTTLPLLIVNPGFETGDITGWTKTGDLFLTGGVNQWGAVTTAGAMSTPHGGTYFAEGRATGPIGSGPHMTGLYQRLDVSAYSTEVDLGTATVNIVGYGHGETSQDKAKLRIAFYDAVSGGNQLGSNVDSNEATQSQIWTPLTISSAAVPVGTRSIELFLLGEKASTGSYLDAGIDDVSATLSYP